MRLGKVAQGGARSGSHGLVSYDGVLYGTECCELAVMGRLVGVRQRKVGRCAVWWRMAVMVCPGVVRYVRVAAWEWYVTVLMGVLRNG